MGHMNLLGPFDQECEVGGNPWQSVGPKDNMHQFIKNYQNGLREPSRLFWPKMRSWWYRW